MPTKPVILVIEDANTWFVVERGKPTGASFSNQEAALRAASDRAAAIAGRVEIHSRFGHYVETASGQFVKIDEESD